MDIHKPKPWHGVREFLKEYAIIVVGVLTALAAEQAVEAVHWRHKVAESEQSMRIQLSTDDGAQAFARAVVTRCLDDKLKDIIAAVEAGADRSEVSRLANAYRPPHRSWDRQAWEAAVGSDVASHIGAARLNVWGGAFGLTYTLSAQTAKETDAIDLLTGASDAKGMLSAERADRLLGAAKSLRRTNFEMDAYSLLMLRWLASLNAAPSKRDQATILAEARNVYGLCAAPPDLAQARPDISQYSAPDDLAQRK